jgi:hypothetical protein
MTLPTQPVSPPTPAPTVSKTGYVVGDSLAGALLLVRFDDGELVWCRRRVTANGALVLERIPAGDEFPPRGWMPAIRQKMAQLRDLIVDNPVAKIP